MNITQLPRFRKPESSFIDDILGISLVNVHIKHLSKLVRLKISELDASLLAGTVNLPFQPSVGKEINLLICVGKNSWTTSGTLISIEQAESTYRVKISLSQGHKRSNSQSRASTRWKNSDFLPIIAQLIDPLQYEKKHT